MTHLCDLVQQAMTLTRALADRGSSLPAAGSPGRTRRASSGSGAAGRWPCPRVAGAGCPCRPETWPGCGTAYHRSWSALPGRLLPRAQGSLQLHSNSAREKQERWPACGSAVEAGVCCQVSCCRVRRGICGCTVGRVTEAWLACSQAAALLELKQKQSLIIMWSGLLTKGPAVAVSQTLYRMVLARSQVSRQALHRLCTLAATEPRQADLEGCGRAWR